VFEILVRDHATMLSAFLRSTVPADAVDDLFQETMLIAWRRLGDYERDRPFAPWLRGIATRLALKHRATRARDAGRIEAREIEQVEARFAQATERHDGFDGTIDRLLHCLQRLPSKLAAAIDLVYRGGLPTVEAARQLDVSEDAVRKRVQRGRRLLAECLGPEVTQ